MWPGGWLPGSGVLRGPPGGCRSLERQGDGSRKRPQGHVQLGALQTATLLYVWPVFIASAHERLLGAGGGASAAPQTCSPLGSAQHSASLGSPLGPAGCVARGLWLPAQACLAASSSHGGPLACGEHRAWPLPFWFCLQIQACGSWPWHGVASMWGQWPGQDHLQCLGLAPVRLPRWPPRAEPGKLRSQRWSRAACGL